MKYCRKCGAKLEKEFLYCPVCGESFTKTTYTSAQPKNTLSITVNVIRGNELRVLQLLAIVSAVFLFLPWFEIGLTEVSKTKTMSGDQLALAAEFWMIDGIILIAVLLEKWLDRVWILLLDAVCAVLNMTSLLSVSFEMKNILSFINPIASQTTGYKLQIKSTGWFKLELVVVLLVGIISGYFIYEIKQGIYYQAFDKRISSEPRSESKKIKSCSTEMDVSPKEETEKERHDAKFHQPPHL